MILVFVGSGGSAAVDPKQYPDTQGFFDQLPKAAQGSPLYTFIVDFLREDLKKEKIDIEDMMAYLDQFQVQYRSLADPRTLVRKTITGQFPNIARSSISNLDSMERDFVDPLNKVIKRRLYEFYGKRPSLGKSSVWVTFLRDLQEIDPAIEIFTTNYDRVLEEAIEQAGINVIPGMISYSRGTKLETSFWDPRRPSPSNNHGGLLTKLHGSIDWQHEDGDIIKSGPYYTLEDQNHCILYPGYKGIPTEEPFRIFHEHLGSVIQREPQAVIFIGFAFRDDYINSILGNISEEIPAFYFTKLKEGEPGSVPLTDKPPRNAPYTKSLLHFTEGFTQEAALTCLHAIVDHIRGKMQTWRFYDKEEDDPRKNPWKEFTPESVETETDRPGVYELGGEKEQVVHADGSPQVRSALRALLTGSQKEDAKLYRVEYTEDFVKRANELKRPLRKNNRLPPGDD